jgi:small subunit ribosomal protein S17
MSDSPETPENETAQSDEAVAEEPVAEKTAAEEPAAEETAAAETPAEEPAAAETPAEEPAASEEPSAEEPAAPEAEEPAAPEADAAERVPPVEELSPKERRRRERSRHVGKPRAPRSPEERHAERVTERRVRAGRRRAVRTKARDKRRAHGAKSTPPAAEGAPSPAAQVDAAPAKTQKVRQGVVVSDKPDKTITVRISSTRRHRRYEKIVRSSRTLHAHDENNEAHEGDVVRLIESRPLSHTKRWRLVEVLERAQ